MSAIALYAGAADLNYAAAGLAGSVLTSGWLHELVTASLLLESALVLLSGLPRSPVSCGKFISLDEGEPIPSLIGSALGELFGLVAADHLLLAAGNRGSARPPIGTLAARENQLLRPVPCSSLDRWPLDAGLMGALRKLQVAACGTMIDCRASMMICESTFAVAVCGHVLKGSNGSSFEQNFPLLFPIV